MIPSKNYKGIEYVQLSDLPLEQQERMVKTLNKEFYIKILVNGEIISKCVQYKDYRTWFENIYSAKPVVREAVEENGILANNIQFKPI